MTQPRDMDVCKRQQISPGGRGQDVKMANGSYSIVYADVQMCSKESRRRRARNSVESSGVDALGRAQVLHSSPRPSS
jgi:hypothetical protein